MIKIVVLVLLSFFKDDDSDPAPSFHSAIIPFGRSMQDCQDHKKDEMKEVIPPEAVVEGAECYEITLYPKDSI